MRRGVPAAFIRGGTSKGVFFLGSDLPPDRASRDRIFLKVIGSPDPHRRQLNGMGGGISSLSKAVIVEPSARDGVDVDYTFAQVAVDQPVVDYSATCGNLSSAVGPFAVDSGLLAVSGEEAVVRVFNTNTGKIYHARFPVRDGEVEEAGDFAIPGVAGSGARVRLDYLEPGGATTGRFLPSGEPLDQLSVDGLGRVEVSLADATNALVMVEAAALGCAGTESPAELDADERVMSILEVIRRAGGVKMGLANRPEDVSLSNPKVAMVSSPAAYRTLSGETQAAAEQDLTVRLVSMGNVHRAVALTGAMCLAAAAKVSGSIPNRLARGGRDSADTRIGTPSGVVPVGADVTPVEHGWHAARVRVYRTQRRLMDGTVYA